MDKRNGRRITCQCLTCKYKSLVRQVSITLCNGRSLEYDHSFCAVVEVKTTLGRTYDPIQKGAVVSNKRQGCDLRVRLKVCRWMKEQVQIQAPPSTNRFKPIDSLSQDIRRDIVIVDSIQRCMQVSFVSLHPRASNMGGRIITRGSIRA